MLRWASASFLAKGTGRHDFSRDREVLEGSARGVKRGGEGAVSGRVWKEFNVTPANTEKFWKGLEEFKGEETGGLEEKRDRRLWKRSLSAARAVRGQDPRCPSGVRRWAIYQKTASRK